MNVQQRAHRASKKHYQCSQASVIATSMRTHVTKAIKAWDLKGPKSPNLANFGGTPKTPIFDVLQTSSMLCKQ
jgi:hypothetical protein